MFFSCTVQSSIKLFKVDNFMHIKHKETTKQKGLGNIICLTQLCPNKYDDENLSKTLPVTICKLVTKPGDKKSQHKEGMAENGLCNTINPGVPSEI